MFSPRFSNLENTFSSIISVIIVSLFNCTQVVISLGAHWHYQWWWLQHLFSLICHPANIYPLIKVVMLLVESFFSGQNLRVPHLSMMMTSALFSLRLNLETCFSIIVIVVVSFFNSQIIVWLPRAPHLPMINYWWLHFYSLFSSRAISGWWVRLPVATMTCWS